MLKRLSILAVQSGKPSTQVDRIKVETNNWKLEFPLCYR